jgi:23S rRNA (cytidine1920-2'-O)/16S rRNA (cytidine1409-2'-O)-methyltransferase
MSAERHKTRLDHALVERGLCATRARAREAVLAGLVSVDGSPARKPAQAVAGTADIALTGPPLPWVSRAALKLVHGLDHFGIDPAGLVCLDLGASTGGFTQALLARGAKRVFAVDVGHGQLDARLAEDPRVVSLERLNARDLSARQVPEPPGLVVCDVSFIGLELVLPPALALARPGARLVALVKPQFEVGRSHIGKGGIVRDPALHEAACARISRWLEAEVGWQVLGLTPSPIEGSDGNREFLVAARKPAPRHE